MIDNKLFNLFIYKLLKMSDKNIRKIVREMIKKEIKLNEFDAIMPKKQDWNKEAETLRSDLTDLLKNIENDEYVDGLKKIDVVVGKLQVWKNKIQKFL